jgi:glycosyltransferase involved in cell wall biosynthesis
MLNDQVKISVIIPVKNGEKTIQKTVESVLTQSYKFFECIIVHGDSHDKTKKILDEKFSFLKIIHGKDKSIADAMNKGIVLSTGSLISVLNSGDTYHKDTLKKAVVSHLKNPNDVLHGNMRVFFEDGRYYEEIAPKHPNFNLGMVINHPTMFIPKIIMDKNGYYDDSFQISCDLEICVRYSQKKIKFKKICDDILVDYEVGGISTQRPKIVIQEAHRIRKMYKMFRFIDFRYYKGLILFFLFGKTLTMISHKKRLFQNKRAHK